MKQNQFSYSEAVNRIDYQPRKKSKLFRKFLRFLGLVVVLAAIHQTIFNAWFWHDFSVNLNYQPPKNIAEIANQIGLNPDARQIFYASRPEVLSKEEFGKNCINRLEETSVLGCYKDDKIYVFNVENSELEGIKQVTAAHEFLHAAWRRMSQSERLELGKKLRAEYQRLKTPDFEKTMAGYAKTQPGEHENELHSIIGTEHGEISADLEAHYAKFFKNRQEIVRFHRNYNQKFKNLEQKIKNLETEIDRRRLGIEKNRQQYEQDLNIYNQAVDRFNYRAQNGGFLSQGSFLAERDWLLAWANSLKYQSERLSAEISTVNQMISELNSLATRSHNLYQSIDSNLSKPN